MSSKNAAVVSFEGFAAQYMAAGTEPQQGAIRVYPLAMAPALIQPPTPLFRAEYNFLLLIQAGGGQQQVDNELLTLQANDVLFIREGHLNAIKSIDPDTAGYYVYLDSALLPQVFADSTLLHRLTFYPKHSVSEADMQWLARCCELLAAPHAANAYATHLRCTLLRALVLKLAEASPAALARPDRLSELSLRFKELLYEHFLSKRDVAFYADALAVSENYLNRCVRTATGKPPKQHINEMVINHSKVLLQNPAKDVAQVAFELNFSDPSYFGRLFKQLTQQTPRAYRSALLPCAAG
ncbi:AraC family transcriptional regulator [Hymenobacter oligotrophus]|uniref:AraC family transcriptional regulator n=1 Tax=Hymenobacter oligotrophus TaxID=2319843 RepID=A0A3B7R550_9BACT|nr:AraC family transcriptional regulator [Hymenobacter oligotrophus]AYA38852.1 AraC family transcriptional regulator [Hymenobacter oligotrophus]